MNTSKQPKIRLRCVMKICYLLQSTSDSILYPSLMFIQQFVMFLKSILLHLIHTIHKPGVWAYKISHYKTTSQRD